MDGEAMIHSITHGEQPFPIVTQVSLAGTTPNAPHVLKDPKLWTAKEKRNDTAQELWDALERQMRGSEYGEQDRKAAILYEYATFKTIEGEQLLDTYLQYLQVINDMRKCGYKKDNSMGHKKNAVVVTSDPLALVAEKTKVNKRKEKVAVQLREVRGKERG
ncbi:hypothetical protein Tco_0605883 [Tanacetum coccineum]